MKMSEKIGFFRRIKKAIFNFEDYSKFANENMGKAFGYFFKLTVLITIVVSVCITYQTYKITENAINIFKSKVPNFSIKEGVLETENNEKFEYVDEDNYLGIIIDANEENIENIKYENTIAFLKNKIYISTINNQANVVSYSEVISENFGKNDIEKFITQENLTKAYALIGITVFIANLIVYILVFLIEILILSVIGHLIKIIAKVELKYSQVFKIAIYAKTLPFILLTIYSSVVAITNFTIKYFDLAYDAIAYIYIITSILMMKSDVLKNKQEIITPIKKKEEEKPKNKEKKEDKEEEKKEEEKQKKEKKQEKGENPGEPETSKA